MSAAAKEVEEFVRQYFIDEEDASINDCVRDGLDLRVPLTPALVSNIRRRLRQEHYGKFKLTVVPAPVLQPKSWVKEWPSDKPPPEPVVEVQEPVKPTEQTGKAASIAERRHYYDEVLLSDPTQTVVAAMRKVKAKFGRSVDPGYAVASLRMVRELAANIPKPAPPVEINTKEQAVPKEDIDEYIITFKDTITATAISGRNPLISTVVVNKAGIKQQLVDLSSRGVSAESIKVYKRVKVRLSVSADFEE